MELRHLRYFVAVAEAGSFTKAAQSLHIQQPPLGQQIRDLEAELGVALFDRYPRKIVLNSTGEVFLADAREILTRAARAVENVRRYEKGESGRLSVGLTSSASLHVLAPEFLQRFRAAFPLVDIEVVESETYELILALQQQRIDAALLHIDAQRFPDLVSAALSHEHMLVAVPRAHRLADESLGPLTLSMLAREEMVAYRRPDGPGIFERITKTFDDAGLTPIIVDEAYRIIAAINLVAGNRGITLVPASLQILHREAVVYRALAPGELPPLGLYVSHRRGNRLALVNNFIDLTKKIAAEANARTA
jgi:DNA-binding transcriptional LysR family regulator